MKFRKLNVLSVAVLASSIAHADVEVSGEVTFTNNFMFRGISLSDNGAAVQGEISVQNEAGFYATLWGSSTSLRGGGGAGSGLEGNLLLGYTTEVGEVTYDVGYLRYFYPGADRKNGGPRLSFNEIYGSATYKGFTLGAAFSEDYFAETGRFFYTHAGYEHQLAENLTGMVHVGYNRFDRTDFMGTGDKNYIDYSVGVGTSLGGVDFTASYIGVDSKGKRAFENSLGANQFVVTMSKSF